MASEPSVESFDIVLKGLRLIWKLLQRHFFWGIIEGGGMPLEHMELMLELKVQKQVSVALEPDPLPADWAEQCTAIRHFARILLVTGYTRSRYPSEQVFLSLFSICFLQCSLVLSFFGLIE